MIQLTNDQCAAIKAHFKPIVANRLSATPSIDTDVLVSNLYNEFTPTFNPTIQMLIREVIVLRKGGITFTDTELDDIRGHVQNYMNEHPSDDFTDVQTVYNLRRYVASKTNRGAIALVKAVNNILHEILPSEEDVKVTIENAVVDYFDAHPDVEEYKGTPEIYKHVAERLNRISISPLICPINKIVKSLASRPRKITLEDAVLYYLHEHGNKPGEADEIPLQQSVSNTLSKPIETIATAIADVQSRLANVLNTRRLAKEVSELLCSRMKVHVILLDTSNDEYIKCSLLHADCGWEYCEQTWAFYPKNRDKYHTVKYTVVKIPNKTLWRYPQYAEGYINAIANHVVNVSHYLPREYDGLYGSVCAGQHNQTYDNCDVYGLYPPHNVKLANYVYYHIADYSYGRRMRALILSKDEYDLVLRKLWA